MSINWKFPTQPLKFDEKKKCVNKAEKKKMSRTALQRINWTGIS